VGIVGLHVLAQGRRAEAEPLIRRTLAVAAVLALALGTRAASAPTWSAVTRLSTGDRALGPEMALNALGNGIVVWDDWVGTCANPAALECIHIVEAASRGSGGPWAAPIEISRPGVGSGPQVAIDGTGDAAILWVHDIGRDRVVQATYRKGLNGSFPEPSDVSEPIREVRDQSIGLDGVGDAVAAWAERYSPEPDSHFAIRVAIRSASTGAWAAAVTLAPSEGNLFGGPSLAVTPAGLAAVTWIQDGFPRVALGDIRLGSWSTPQDVSQGSGGATVGRPGVAMDEAGDVVVAWPASGDELRAAYFSRARGAWDPQRRIGDFRGLGRPSLAIDTTGGALAVWPSPRGLESASRATETGIWSSPRLISDPRSDVNTAALALDPRGNAVALWTAGARGALQTALRPGATGEWMPPTRLSDDGAASPRVGMDATRTALAVWMRFSGGPASAPYFHVETAQLDGAGPVIQRLRAPHRVTRGARASFSVDVVPWATPLAGRPSWRFGDGGVATGARVTHRYRRFGRYAVAVIQADAGGNSTTTRATVVVGAPRVARRPSLRGVIRFGSTLVCLPGSWAGATPIRFEYVWLRDGFAIPGATSARYRVDVADLGETLGCRVQAKNRFGSARANSRQTLVVAGG
jgi:PKD domain-containing protein